MTVNEFFGSKILCLTSTYEGFSLNFTDDFLMYPAGDFRLIFSAMEM